MTTQDQKETEKKEVQEIEATPIDPQELLKRILFKPGVLVWKNFNTEQPGLNRHIIIWCNLGPLTQNLFISFRDNLGNYDLPHPTKVYPVQAWAYIDLPEADPQSIVDAEREIRAQQPKA